MSVKPALSEETEMQVEPTRPDQQLSHGDKVGSTIAANHLENTDTVSAIPSNLLYANEDEEPEIHITTWIAYASMVVLIFVQSMSLQAPPSVLSYIAADLKNTAAETWVPNSLSLVQASLGPVICLASDTFQIRKPLLIVSCAIALVGSGIAPGSGSIYRLIAAQTLIGVGFAAIPITFSIPSEILPRKWRPMAQAVLNVFAALAAISGPLIIGALIKRNAHTGWRQFYWLQFALWGLCLLGIIFCYRPPKRHTRFEHLSFWQKLGCLDLPGSSLLTTGLVLFLVGLNLGGNLYAWTSSRVLATMIIGIFILIVFGIWEWKGTKNGILHHEMFKGENHRGRSFAIYTALIFIEAILLFTFAIFYPVMTTSLFATDSFLSTARLMPYWVGFTIGAPIYGYISTRTKKIRSPMFVGYAFFTAGILGLATIQLGDNFSQLAFAALAGLGFGGPIVLIVSGVQLIVPHHLIATSTAVTISSRAIGASIFTAIYAATLTDGLTEKIPRYVAKAAANAGLTPSSIPAFVAALAGNDEAALAAVPGATSTIVSQGATALKQAYADSLRPIFIIGVPFGVVACVMCFWLGDLKDTMTYRVDAPVETLHAKQHHDEKGV